MIYKFKSKYSCICRWLLTGYYPKALKCIVSQNSTYIYIVTIAVQKCLTIIYFLMYLPQIVLVFNAYTYYVCFDFSCEETYTSLIEIKR